MDHQLESLTPVELRALSRIDLWRTSERKRLRNLLRATVISGFEELDDPSADPADLIALADAQARRLRAELEDADAPEELGEMSTTILRLREEEREHVRAHMHDTALLILDFISSDNFGSGLSAPTIALLASAEAGDLQRWIDTDEPAVARVEAGNQRWIDTIGEPAAAQVEARSLDSRPHLSRRDLRGASDERLVVEIRAGSRMAFEVVYDRHRAGIFAFCRHMLGSREEAEDVVQDTFAAAYQALLADDAREIALRACLYAIARNRCLSVLRVRREHLGLEDADARVPASADLSVEVERREDLRALLDDLQSLPDDHRAALVLAELGAQSHEEIAAILGVPTAKVKALVFQAREALMSRRLAREADCGSIREQLAVLRGGARRRRELRHHVAQCDGCRAFEAEVRHQRAGIDSQQLRDDPAGQPAAD